jgi:putative urate catabolism protein
MPIDPSYPRDLIGYGRTPPDPKWPGGAKLAINFVVNYEEGGENCLLHGDIMSEAYLSEITAAQNWPYQRHMSMESLYEYGSRKGFWRLWRLFTARKLPVTVFGVAAALSRNPEAVAAMTEASWEMASHGLRWIDYKDFSYEAERAHFAEAIRLHEEVTGAPPTGWYQGRTSTRSREITAELGLAYSADSYADELPYWEQTPHGPLLIVPYTLDANDMRFVSSQGWGSAGAFHEYLSSSVALMLEEGRAGMPGMLSVGLHCRLVGRPSRAAMLARFLDEVADHPEIWVTTRAEIAAHWRKHFPAPPT